MSTYNSKPASVTCDYVPKQGEKVFVLYRYKQQESGSGDGSTCINGYIFDFDTKKILCDTVESKTYYHVGLTAGRHTITPHTNGQWENAERHAAQVNYAGQWYKKPNTTKGAMLRVDSTGCLFHMGRWANDSKGKTAWTTGCCLLGSNPNGENGFPNWEGTTGPGTSNPDANAAGWMNFYSNVYPYVIKSGTTTVLYIMEGDGLPPGGEGASGAGGAGNLGGSGNMGNSLPPNSPRPIMASRGQNTVYKLASSGLKDNTLTVNSERKEKFEAMQQDFSQQAPELGRDLLITSELYSSEILKGNQNAKTFLKKRS